MPAEKSLLARGLMGQPDVKRFLTAAVSGDRVGQAYLFVGASGSGKLDAARALAQAVLCEQGGCGACDDCMRVANRSHPDVHLLQPQSAQGYLVAQIRDLIDDLSMAPVRAKRRVYILDEAEGLGASAANALLKSLEEPPANATFILLGSSRDAMLPTIVSRCQVVPFRTLPEEVSLALLGEELTVPPQLCRRALGCCPSPAQARDFLGSEQRQEARRLALRALEELPRADALDVLRAATKAVEAAKAPYEDIRQAMRLQLDEDAQWMGASAVKQLEDRQKRELTARERSGIMELLSAQRSLLRDALGLALGTGEQAVCDDFERASAEYAAALGPDLLPRALAAVDLACQRVKSNVSPQLAIEAMLFDIKEMLSCHS